MNLCPICRDVWCFTGADRVQRWKTISTSRTRREFLNVWTTERDARLDKMKQLIRGRLQLILHRLSKESRDSSISVRTAQRRLASFGLHGRRGVKKSLISMKNRIARLWHLHRTTKDWPKLVLSSDEGKFKLLASDGTRWVSRRKK